LTIAESLNPTQGRDRVKNPKSHPREWVDRSGSAYKERDRVTPDFILFLAKARKMK